VLLAFFAYQTPPERLARGGAIRTRARACKTAFWARWSARSTATC